MDLNHLLDEASWLDRRKRASKSRHDTPEQALVSHPSKQSSALQMSSCAADGEHSRQESSSTRDEIDSPEPTNDSPLIEPIHRYRDMRSYIYAAGREAPKDTIRDARDFRSEMAVIDLRRQQPSCDHFLRLILREMKIRKYKPKTVKAYVGAVKSLLSWSGRLPHEVDREMVKEYLLYLVDSDQGFSMISVHSSAIRAVFDKFCFLDITLGLETPRRDRKQPVILSKSEVQKLLEAAVTLRDKLLLGLMYATGVRVSEVVRFRWRDIDLDRNMIAVVQGKGNVDRNVMLPESYRKLFSALKHECGGNAFLFPSESRRSGSRYLSTRTVQRLMKLTVEVAGISKQATPHSLRHSFATHSFEDGCDIRRIQKVLGHVRLETTTLYVRVANPANSHQMPSPLDRLAGSVTPRLRHDGSQGGQVGTDRESGPMPSIHFKKFEGEDCVRATLRFNAKGGPVFLTGIRARECRPGFWMVTLPPLEAWRAEMVRLGSRERQRLQEASFYRSLQSDIARRLTTSPQPASRSSVSCLPTSSDLASHLAAPESSGSTRSGSKDRLGDAGKLSAVG